MRQVPLAREHSPMRGNTSSHPDRRAADALSLKCCTESAVGDPGTYRHWPKTVKSDRMHRANRHIQILGRISLDSFRNFAAHCRSHRDASAIVAHADNDVLSRLEEMGIVVGCDGELSVPTVRPTNISDERKKSLRIDLEASKSAGSLQGRLAAAAAHHRAVVRSPRSRYIPALSSDAASAIGRRYTNLFRAPAIALRRPLAGLSPTSGFLLERSPSLWCLSGSRPLREPQLRLNHGHNRAG